MQEDINGNLDVILEEENNGGEEYRAEEANKDNVEVDEIMNEDIGREIEESIINDNNARPKRHNAGTGVERLEMSFGGKEHASIAKQQHMMHAQGMQFTMKGVVENK